MTKEQKEWFDYGRKKAAWLIAKELEPGSEREITQIAWDARKKAHRWLHKNECEHCKHFEEEWDGSDCPFCSACEKNYWEPKE